MWNLTWSTRTPYPDLLGRIPHKVVDLIVAEQSAVPGMVVLMGDPSVVRVLYYPVVVDGW